MNLVNFTAENKKSKQLNIWERTEIEKALKVGASVSGITRAVYFLPQLKHSVCLTSYS